MRSCPLKKDHKRFPLFILLLLGLMVWMTACQTVEGSTSTALPTATKTPTQSITPPPTLAPAAVEETEHICQEHGEIREFSLESNLLNDTLPFNIYFPPCYDAASTSAYPVIYLLHGQEQSPDLWSALGIQQIADELILDKGRKPFLVVMPAELFPFRPVQNNQFPQAVLQELLPWVEDNLPACTQRTCRAIGGISRGGAWAVRLALINPDVFASLGAHSTPLSEDDLEELPDWIDAIPPEELPRIYIDVGSTDPGVKASYAFDQTLNSLGVPHIWNMNTGRHNEAYWEAQLPSYLEWYTISWLED